MVIRKRKISEFQKFESELEEDVAGVEKWVIERRKFLIKLGIIVIFILLLLAYSHLFTKG